jgi:hypothetical protein
MRRACRAGWIAVPVALLALGACGDNVAPPSSDPPDASAADAPPVLPLHDFTFLASRWDDLVGAPLRIGVVRERDGALVADESTVAMFVHTTVIPELVADSETYTVRWTIDLDADGTCDPPPPLGADPAWQATALLAENGLEFQFHPTDEIPYTDVCATFP